MNAAQLRELRDDLEARIDDLDAQIRDLETTRPKTVSTGALDN